MINKKVIYGCAARGDGNEPYLTRYFLIERKNFQVCIHVFHRSDFDDMHDHPWNFLSIILWRGYLEETSKGKSRKWPGMFLYRKAAHRHRVELLEEKRAVTFVIMGKKFREWGFFTKEGFINFSRYFVKNRC